MWGIGQMATPLLKRIFQGGQNMCLQYAYIVIVNLLLVEHKIVCTMVSLDICRRHNTIRQLLSTGVISLDYVKSKDNITDLLTKGFDRELVEKSMRE